MIRKLIADNHEQPFTGPFTITRIQPGDILRGKGRFWVWSIKYH